MDHGTQRILGAIVILGLSIATLVFDAVPFVWVGGFIWAMYLFAKGVEIQKKEAETKESEEQFNSEPRWKEKAKNQDELTLKVDEISKKYGAGQALVYLMSVEKLTTEQASEILFKNIWDESQPKRKVTENRCIICDGFGTVLKTKRNLLGKFTNRVPCPTCKGTGLSKN